MTDLDPEGRRLLDLTRDARTPTARDRARIEQMLAASLVLGSATAHAGSAAAAAKSTGLAAATKWAAGVAVAAAVGSAGYFGWEASRPASVAVPPKDAATESAPRAPEPRAPTALEMAPVMIPPSPRADDVRRGAAKAEGRAAPEGTLLAELDLLHEAQAKWRKGEAGGALALLGEHRKRFPKSQVVPERDALTVLALCSTNRTAEARKVASRFLRTAPRSPLRTSVEESCGGSGLK